MAKILNLALRGLEAVFTIILLGLVGNIIATAFSGNPSIINYDIFTAVFGFLSLLYLIPQDFNDSFQGHPILPLALDALNTLFYFVAAVATAAKLGAHSCSNSSYTSRNSITNGAHDMKGRCEMAQAATAFFFFAWACWTANLVFSLLGARGGGVNLRSGGIRRGGPSMSQV